MTILNPNTREAYQLLHDGALALTRCEQHGIRVDVKYIKQQKKVIDEKIESLENEFKKTKFFKDWQKSVKGEINIYSDKQLGKFIYDVLGHRVEKRTDKGTPSIDGEALQDLNIPDLEQYLQISKFRTLKNTFLKGIERETVKGIMRPFYHLHLATTFRSSSSDVNFQNQPKRDTEQMNIIRGAIYPSKGNQLMELDYSQLEVRISACVVGSTKIETIDGSQTIKKVICRVKNNENVYVYGYNFEKQRIAIAKVTRGGITGKKKEVWKITLDNGKSIITTPEHKFLTRKEKYVALNELKIGTSLMPFYKKKKQSHWGTVYEEVYLNNGKKMLAHNLIAEDVRGVIIKGSNKLVHHKFGNGCDNSLKNTRIMTRKKHMKIHAVQSWKNNSRKDNIHWSTTNEGKSKIAKQTKEHWDNLKDFEREEMKVRIREGIIKSGGNKQESNGMFGKTHSKESNLKNRNSHLGKKLGPAWNKGLTKETSLIVRQMSNNRKGKVAWNKGMAGVYKTSEETKKKLKIASTGFKHTKESKEKCRNVALKRWENNKPIKCHLCNKEFKVITNTHLENKHGITSKEYKETYNHKIINIEFYGYTNVYNINVKGIHNFATSAGAIIKNCYHKDPTMLKYINDKSTDMHRDMAMQIFKIRKYKEHEKDYKYLRNATKNGFVFPAFYGDYHVGFAKSLSSAKWTHLPKYGIWKPTDGVEFKGGNIAGHLIKHGIDHLGLPTYENGKIKTYPTGFTKHLQDIEKHFWNKRFPVYNQWKEDWYQTYLKNGYFYNKTGFTFQGVMNKKDCINYPVQSSAFHVLLWSLIEAVKAMNHERWKTRIIGQIHDAIVFDLYPPERDHIIDVMKCIMTSDVLQHWSWINVPLEIECELCPVDAPWSKKEEFKIN